MDMHWLAILAPRTQSSRLSAAARLDVGPSDPSAFSPSAKLLVIADGPASCASYLILSPDACRHHTIMAPVASPHPL